MVALGRRPHSWLEDLIRAGDLRPLVFRFFFLLFFFPCPAEETSSCQGAVCSWSGLTDGPITRLQPVSHAGCNWEAPEEQPFFSVK